MMIYLAKNNRLFRPKIKPERSRTFVMELVNYFLNSPREKGSANSLLMFGTKLWVTVWCSDQARSRPVSHMM